MVWSQRRTPLPCTAQGIGAGVLENTFVIAAFAGAASASNASTASAATAAAIAAASIDVPHCAQNDCTDSRSSAPVDARHPEGPAPRVGAPSLRSAVASPGTLPRDEDALPRESRVRRRGREAVRRLRRSPRASPSAQIARLPSGTAPGTTASNVVFTEQVAPTAPAVATHGTVTGNGASCVVAGSLCDGPL